MTRSMTFGAETVGVGLATAGDVGVLGVHTYVLGMGGCEGGPVDISPSNLRKANWKSEETAFLN